MPAGKHKADRVRERWPLLCPHRPTQGGQTRNDGSASIDLLRQSSETLAGRIAYLELAAQTH